LLGTILKNGSNFKKIKKVGKIKEI
jgi:hypothetical protein